MTRERAFMIARNAMLFDAWLKARLLVDSERRRWQRVTSGFLIVKQGVVSVGERALLARLVGDHFERKAIDYRIVVRKKGRDVIADVVVPKGSRQKDER